MLIRELKKSEISDAVRLKIYCEDNDFPNIVEPGTFNYEQELNLIHTWLNEKDFTDIRRLYGAFYNEKFVGFIGSSLAEEDDCDKGVEINYLFIDKDHRGQGIGTNLVKKVVDEYLKQSIKNIIVYCYHESKAFSFYHKFLKGKILRQVIQYPSKKPVLVDIFIWDTLKLQQYLAKKLPIDNH
ncbi:MAG: GNAT family N-acetyltransferase [Candidatus Cloacimonetes bacterium]|nr:GNAT family N-acetyltransferase [Candidatus Cloacimonadota bacterium]